MKNFKKYVDKLQFMTYNNSCISDEAVAEMQIEAWLSLVERCVRDAEVVGSNPVAPIFLYSFLGGKEEMA